jgi:hypothetical protein
VISDVMLPGEIVSTPGLARSLLEFARTGSTRSTEEYENLVRELGCEDPNRLLQDLRAAGFFTRGLQQVSLTSRAYRTLLFLSGALGASSDSVIEELRIVEPGLRRYELVREGMTSRFIKGLLNEPGFRRLYICSPWINMLKEDIGRLATALVNSRRSHSQEPEIFVLVKTPNLPEVERTLNVLRSLGAKVVEKPRLHSKLYMREPGGSGGLSLAILGSENLTRPKWIELGIEIRNDTYILSRLRSYFFEVFGRAQGE